MTTEPKRADEILPHFQCSDCKSSGYVVMSNAHLTLGITWPRECTECGSPNISVRVPVGAS